MEAKKWTGDIRFVSAFHLSGGDGISRLLCSDTSKTVIFLPCRGLLGSVAPQRHSSAKLDGEEVFVLHTKKINGLPGRSGLVLRLEGRCRRQAA
jgi:hypothetical protein